MRGWIFGLGWVLVLALGVDCQAQSARLRAVGFESDRISVRVGQRDDLGDGERAGSAARAGR